MLSKVDLSELVAGYTKKTLSEVPLFDFVGNIDLRQEQIGAFIDKILSQYEHPRVLDLAMGSGQDSISLIKKGYDVVSNEIDDYAIKLAERNAKDLQVSLNIRRVDWIDFCKSNQYESNEFDFIFSLGNSFPNYLISEDDRRASLGGFWKILKPDGILLFDTRNFNYMLNNAQEILENPEVNFNYSYRTTYLGENVKGFPIEITKDKVCFIWKHYKNKTYAELDLWAATIENVFDLIKKTLGDVELNVYFDYHKNKPDHYDFAQFVLKKH